MSEKKRVLLVCPDERLGEIRCMILHSHGYDAMCVYTPAEARQAWSPGAYQLIIVDVQSDRIARSRYAKNSRSRMHASSWR